jgi:hypothetical protein
MIPLSNPTDRGYQTLLAWNIMAWRSIAYCKTGKGKDIGRNGGLTLVTGNGYGNLLLPRFLKSFDTFHQRLQSVRIIRQMVTPGVTFHTNTLGRVLTGGAKMVSPEFPTTISVYVFLLLFGMVKTVCSKSASLA